MVRPIFENFGHVEIKQASSKVEVAKPTTAQAQQVLSEIGENAIALNSMEMEKKKMKPLFKDFNPEHISPKALSKAGMLLFKFGFIDNLTADLMSRAGAEFDKEGKVLNADEPINALEFLAGRIVEMNEKSLWGDPYAKTLLPDYVRTIHVIQNLQVFAGSGDSYEMSKIKKQESSGKRATAPDAKAP